MRLSPQPTGGKTPTGLGLSIAKRLIELIGGELKCVSEFGNGAEFTIGLPSEPPAS